MLEVLGSDHVLWWRRLSNVFVTRAILLGVAVVVVLCLGVALARFDENFDAVRGQIMNYSQGDVSWRVGCGRSLSILISLFPSVPVTVANAGSVEYRYPSRSRRPLPSSSTSSPALPYILGNTLQEICRPWSLLTVCLTMGFLLSAFTTFNNFAENSDCQLGLQWARCIAEADVIQQLELVVYSCGLVLMYAYRGTISFSLDDVVFYRAMRLL